MDDLHLGSNQHRLPLPSSQSQQRTSGGGEQQRLSRRPDQLSHAEVFEAVSALTNSGSTESDSKTSTEQSEGTVMRVRSTGHNSHYNRVKICIFVLFLFVENARRTRQDSRALRQTPTHSQLTEGRTKRTCV